MNDNALPTHVQRPELWTLLLCVGPENVQYMLYAASQAQSLITGEVAIADTGEGYLKSLENAVYDTPLLLDDYGSVRVLLHSPHFVVLPAGVTPEQATAALALQFPDDHGEVLVTAVPHCGVDIAYTLEPGVANFVQRTFNTPPVYHHLYPLCEHATTALGGDTTRMMLDVRSRDLDMAVVKNEHLLLATSQRCHAVSDAAYLAMQAWTSYNLDSEHDELQLMGEAAAVDELTPQLRQFIHYVVPAIIPAAELQLGPKAMDAPRNLLMLALCD